MQFKFINENHININHDDGTPCIELKLEDSLVGVEPVAAMRSICSRGGVNRLGQEGKKLQTLIYALQEFQSRGSFARYKDVNQC